MSGSETALSRRHTQIRQNNVGILDALGRDAGEAASASRCWLIHLADHDLREVHCSPLATHDEVLALHHEVLAVEPFEAVIAPRQRHR